MRVQQPYGKKLFEETQQFRQTWLWWMVIIGSAFPLILTGVILVADKGSSPAERIIAFSVVLGINIINLLIFYLARLDTVITDEAIFYRWWPFFRKYRVAAWADVKEVTIKKYPFFNVGYHKRKGFGKVNVVKGDKGLQLALTSEHLVYLGTQRLPAIEYVLNTLQPKSWKAKVQKIQS